MNIIGYNRSGLASNTVLIVEHEDGAIDMTIHTEYLKQLYEKYGDFKVFSMQNGKLNGWKAWKSYASCSTDELKTVNQRALMPDEIVLDCETSEQVPEIENELKELQWTHETFTTNSRGFHIHMHFPELMDLNDRAVCHIRKVVISHFGCDTAKQSGLIALEYANHWKSGKPKLRTALAEYGKVNKLDPKLIEIAKNISEAEASEPINLANCTKELNDCQIDTLTKSFVPYWKQGQRHSLTFYLSGWAMKNGFSQESCMQLIKRICSEANDPEMRERINTVNFRYTTNANLPQNKICGISGIEKLLWRQKND